MANDIVERAEFGAEVQNVHGMELNVLQADVARKPPGLGDLRDGKVDAEELAAGQLLRHGNKVAAAGATYFQYAALPDGLDLQAEESADGSQAIGVGLRERSRGISHAVVTRCTHRSTSRWYLPRRWASRSGFSAITDFS